MYRLFLFLFLILPFSLTGQKDEFDDLQAIKNQNKIFYNLGAYSITTETFSSPFTIKKLKPILRKYEIRLKKKTVLVSDSLVKTSNFRFIQSTNEGKYTSKYAVYAVDNNRRTSIISFAKIGNFDDNLMSSFVNRFVNDEFPEYIYVRPKIDSIKFVNRYIKLGPGCQWMGVRNVQCPYNGQMDWTLHNSLKETREFNTMRSSMALSQNKLKLVSKDSVDITFEGKNTIAERYVMDVKGLNSLLLNLQSGAKELIVYYISEEIGGKYVSCILSHWNNDRVQPHGLPALLGEVMRLKK